eukprot:10561153-Heterocapsa_arctica.AAC.1
MPPCQPAVALFDQQVKATPSLPTPAKAISFPYPFTSSPPLPKQPTPNVETDAARHRSQWASANQAPYPNREPSDPPPPPPGRATHNFLPPPPPGPRPPRRVAAP